MLNLEALKDAQKDLTERTQSSGKDYFFAKSIGECTDVRLLPPLPTQNGIYFHEVIKFWINGKPYMSPLTFGRAGCPLDEELELAKDGAKTDASLKKLLEKFQKKSEFHMPMLLLDIKEDASGNIAAITVIDDAPKILSAGTMLIKAINKLVTSRQYQNATEDGLMDRVKGWNITLSKTGKGLDTEYAAIGWTAQTEMAEKHYTAIPDVMEKAKKELKSDEFLRKIARNYLYGEDLPAEDKPAADSGTATAAPEEKPAASRGRGAAKTSDVEAEAPKAAGRGRRDIIGDMENMG